MSKLRPKLRLKNLHKFKFTDLEYFIGAYYLIKLRSIDSGKIKGSKVFTCSNCINDSYLDSWSISWANSNDESLEQTKSNFNLTANEIVEIQNWSDKKFNDKRIGWSNTFSDLETLLEYKNQFFPDEIDFQILSINFPENEKTEFLKVFDKESDYAEIGLSINLEKSILENETEVFLGFDLIGVEISGDFHSFHCHDLAKDLIQKFNVKINEFGLIESHNNWDDIILYMNDESNGFEATPWFLVKVKRVNKPAHNRR